MHRDAFDSGKKNKKRAKVAKESTKITIPLDKPKSKKS